MDSRNIPITQFADTCGIPRPTLSQLLNGRNKKVSDEFISKIHDAYPALNVLWLMFGEGSMTSDANSQTSEPQITPSLNFDEPQPTAAQTPAADDLFNLGVPENSPKKSEPAPTIDFSEHAPLSPAPAAAKPEGSSHITISTDSGRRIVNIIVVYSDNSIQSFVPAT